MHRRHLLALLPATLLLGAAAPAPTADEQQVLTRIQDYLNGIRTLKARFLQVGPDGRESGGTVWLERPGRMRFQYDPPTPYLLVAGHGLLVFYDSQLQQTSNIPLGSTPLGILLADQVRLSGPVMVTGFSHPPGLYEVTLVRTGSPQDGSLTLFFTDDPLALRSWVVVDAQHRATRVTLYDVQRGGQFAQSLFTFIDPKFFRNGPAH
ncbi:MAG TPA: outer membrane lipoprotein carrier protein LolA [Acetobacteraceae bacterium]|nr:outer membrane lipoprotein carrier protein LolA [Acetobacteraceae bacterium]